MNFHSWQLPAVRHGLSWQRIIPGSRQLYFHGTDSDDINCTSYQKHNPNAKVVFIGPCAAKKLEAMRRSVRSEVDFVLTFEEMAGILMRNMWIWKTWKKIRMV